MNLKFYLEKLHASDQFKKFIKENPEAFPCSCFFVIDKEGKDNKQHIDYFCPPVSSKISHSPQARNIDTKQLTKNNSVNNSKSEERERGSEPSNDRVKRGNIFSFQLENNCKLAPIEMIDNKMLDKISLDYDFDFDKIEQMIINEMIYKSIDKKIQKILLSLQNVKGKDCLIGTVFISGLGMLKINIDISEMKITVFEKKSFFDMVRKK